jgi:hypothetical protein
MERQSNDAGKRPAKSYGYHFCSLAEQLGSGLNEIKKDRGLLSFDDMIDNLHQAVCIAAPDELLKGIREKFKAVFIDEFQDTIQLNDTRFSAIVWPAFRYDCIYDLVIRNDQPTHGEKPTCSPISKQ